MPASPKKPRAWRSDQWALYWHGCRFGSHLACRMFDAIDLGMEPAIAIEKIWLSHYNANKRPLCLSIGQFVGARRRFERVGRAALKDNCQDRAGLAAELFLMVEQDDRPPSGHDMLEVVAEWRPKRVQRSQRSFGDPT
jgi:hypothetical protein